MDGYPFTPTQRAEIDIRIAQKVMDYRVPWYHAPSLMSYGLGVSGVITWFEHAFLAHNIFWTAADGFLVLFTAALSLHLAERTRHMYKEWLVQNSPLFMIRISNEAANEYIAEVLKPALN